DAARPAMVRPPPGRPTQRAGVGGPARPGRHGPDRPGGAAGLLGPVVSAPTAPDPRARGRRPRLAARLRRGPPGVRPLIAPLGTEGSLTRHAGWAPAGVTPRRCERAPVGQGRSGESGRLLIALARASTGARAERGLATRAISTSGSGGRSNRPDRLRRSGGTRLWARIEIPSPARVAARMPLISRVLQVIRQVRCAPSNARSAASRLQLGAG